MATCDNRQYRFQYRLDVVIGNPAYCTMKVGLGLANEKRQGAQACLRIPTESMR